MSDNARSRVTVTLGRGGRVVKRAGGVVDDGYSNGVSMAGSKRSIRDRLGSDVDDRNQQYDKRHRGESFGTSSLNDRLGKNDLRFKLMEKSMIRQSHNNDSRGNVDLRDKLSSRSSRPSVDNKSIRLRESSVSARHSMREPMEAGLSRSRMLGGRDPAMLGQAPSSRATHDLSMMNPGRSYSSWTLDNLRRRSPERPLRPSASRGLSPPERSRDDLQNRSMMRPYGDGRTGSSMRISPARHVTSSSYLTASALPVPPVKPIVPVPARYPQASGIMPKIPSMADEPPSVESLLHSLGLEKYAIYFKAEEVDMNALRQMGDNDLKELGIPMGPRKKILQAVMPRPRRQP